MNIELLFLILAGILFFGFIGELIFKKTKIPDVIWLMLIGILIGSILRWISADALSGFAELFTTFALIFLLFQAGINTELKSFLKSAPKGLHLSILSFLITWLLIFGIGMILGKGIELSLLLGAILGGVSSAVVIPIINSLELTPRTKMSMLFDSAFSDVLCILATVTVVEIITLKTSFDGFGIANTILSSFMVAIATGAIFAFLWINVIQNKVKEHNIILTLAVMLIAYSFTELLSANGAIACLVFGLILANSRNIDEMISETSEKTKKTVKSSDSNIKPVILNKSGKDFYEELAFTVKTFFFVYLGILMDFTHLKSFLIALLLVVVIYLARPLAVLLSFGKETKKSEAQLVSTLIPKGLAAAVLVQLPIQAGIPGAEVLVNIVLATIFLSIIVSTISVTLITNNKFNKYLPFIFKKYREE